MLHKLRTNPRDKVGKLFLQLSLPLSRRRRHCRGVRVSIVTDCVFDKRMKASAAKKNFSSGCRDIVFFVSLTREICVIISGRCLEIILLR
jgi:hypothetical protein